MDHHRPRPPLRVTTELLAFHRRRAGELRAEARRDAWRWLRDRLMRSIRRSRRVTR